MRPSACVCVLYIILIVLNSFWWRHVQFCVCLSLFDSLKFKMRSIVFCFSFQASQLCLLYWAALLLCYMYIFILLFRCFISIAHIHTHTYSKIPPMRKKIFKVIKHAFIVTFLEFRFPFLAFLPRESEAKRRKMKNCTVRRALQRFLF